jgi:diguanylate cyclase (GGDEF)-like protein
MNNRRSTIIDRILRAFIPTDISQNIDEFSHTKNLVGACIISIVASFGYALIYYLLDFSYAAHVIMINELILVSALASLYFRSSLVFARTAFLGSLTLLVLWISLYSGGIYSSSAYWLILPSLVATFVAGFRSGYRWCTITLMAAALLYYLQYIHYPLPKPPITDPLILEFLGICGLNLVVLTLAYFYEVNVKSSIDKLHAMAYQDFLTGLPNREAYNQLLLKAVNHSNSTGNIFSVVYIDIDNFKNINAIFSYKIGDTLLCEIMNRIKSEIPLANNISRVAGDGFKIIIENAFDLKSINNSVIEIFSVFKKPFQIINHEIEVTVSLGYVTYDPLKDESNYIDRYLDIAIDKAKKVGGNHFQYFTRELMEEFRMRLAIEKSLPHAIFNNELLLNFQLQYNAIDTSIITGIEVLLRWNNKIHGEISPDIFIPIAEKIGLISQLDDWVLNRACAIYRVWSDAGLVDDDISFAVNVSAQQLYVGNFVSSVQAALYNHGIKPNNLIIELTETAIVSNYTNAAKILHELNKIGVHSVIDDFGVGNTSLSYLTMLPVVGLKMEKSFLNMHFSEYTNQRYVIKAMIDLAHKLKLKVITEGIENPEQAKFLKDLDCDELQGYYFHRPCDEKNMQIFLERRNILQH